VVSGSGQRRPVADPAHPPGQRQRGGDRSILRTQVDALAWAIDDVRKRDHSTPLTVLTIGSEPILDTAERVYDALGAQLVREEQLDQWIDAATTRLVLALSE